MGMAGHAPMDSYKRRFGITTHAIERFRERAGEWLRERGYSDDIAVGHALDVRVSEAWDAGKVQDILYEGRAAKLVDLESPELGRLYAALMPDLMRKNTWAVTTTLTGEMHDRSWESGAYTLPPPVGPVVEKKPALPVVAPRAPEPASFFVQWVEADGSPQGLAYDTREAVAALVKRVAKEGGTCIRVYGELPLTLKVTVDVDF